jgi:uncharacterized protein YbjT (DUF2867 family)
MTMTNILILGAYGQIARVATKLFLETTDAKLTLYLRNAKRLKNFGHGGRVRIIEGDAQDVNALKTALKGQDVVYANLSGNLAEQAKAITDAMKATGVKRIIFISSMGIDDEVPGQRYRSVLDPYRDAAGIVEESGLDYTVIRPEWLNDDDEISYGTTQKGEPFKNPTATVSRRSVADLVVKLSTTPGMEVQRSLGVHKPI